MHASMTAIDEKPKRIDVDTTHAIVSQPLPLSARKALMEAISPMASRASAMWDISNFRINSPKPLGPSPRIISASLTNRESRAELNRL